MNHNKRLLASLLGAATIVSTVAPTFASTYQVQPGDTLSSIAKANGTTVEQLVKDTGIADANKLRVGDTLTSVNIKEEYVRSKGQDPTQTARKTLTNSEIELLKTFFNAEEYAKMNPDVVNTLGNDQAKLFDHFLKYGLWENRQPSKNFSAVAYASAYSDLKAAFGNDVLSYYKHFYQTTVEGTENRTITTVEKAQEAGVKVTDFSGNAVAVDKNGNIVTGKEAENISSSYRSNQVSTVTVEQTSEKEETVVVKDKEESKPETPSKPAVVKTFANAYKEWMAKKPAKDSSEEDFEKWYEAAPNLEDYADGRKYVAEYQAWSEKMPDYETYLAKTDYASKLATWKANEPKIEDYLILVGSQNAEEKYAEDYADWVSNKPVPEDFIEYTSFSADLDKWLAKAPKEEDFSYGAYKSLESAMEAFESAHDEWENAAPKAEDYFDSEAYDLAVEEWEKTLPDLKNYADFEGYSTAVSAHEADEPQPEDFPNVEAFEQAVAEHEAKEPQPSDYFDIDAFESAQNAFATQSAEREAYVDKMKKYGTYLTQKEAYDEYLKKVYEYDNYKTERDAIDDRNQAKRYDYETELEEYSEALRVYNAYKDWESSELNEYAEHVVQDEYRTMKYLFNGVYYDTREEAQQAEQEYQDSGAPFDPSNPSPFDPSDPSLQITEEEIQCWRCDLVDGEEFNTQDEALAAAKEQSKPEVPADTENEPVEPEMPELESLPEEVEEPELVTQPDLVEKPEGYDEYVAYEASPSDVEKPEGYVDEPEAVDESSFVTPLGKGEGATDKASANNLYNQAHGAWETEGESIVQDNYIDNDAYTKAQEDWEGEAPVESDFIYGDFGTIAEADAAYRDAVSKVAAAPSESDYIGTAGEAAGATDKASAEAAFDSALDTYKEENAEPLEETFTSDVGVYDSEEEASAAYDQAVEDHEADKPKDSDYVEAAKETDEYKAAVEEHGDGPKADDYVDDVYATDEEATADFNANHTEWETDEPSKDEAIAGTTYDKDYKDWEANEPDFGKYFGVEVPSVG